MMRGEERERKKKALIERVQCLLLVTFLLKTKNCDLQMIRIDILRILFSSLLLVFFLNFKSDFS